MQAPIEVATSGINGLELLQDINAANAAMVTLLAGPSAPTAAGLGVASLSGVYWRDTTTNTLKIRDQADSAWILVGTFDETNKVFTPAGTGTTGHKLGFLDGANIYSAPQTPAATALTDAATVAWDASKGNLFTLTTAASRTIAAPSGGVAGTSYRLVLTTGGFSPAWNAVFKFPGGQAPSGLSGVCVFDFYTPDGTTFSCTGQSVAEA